MVCKTTRLDNAFQGERIAREGGPRIKFCITSMFRGWGDEEETEKNVRRETGEKGK